MPNPFRSHDYIAMIVLVMLFALAVLSFFVVPRDQETVKNIVGCLVTVIGMILSFKFGVHQVQTAQQKAAEKEGEK